MHDVQQTAGGIEAASQPFVGRWNRLVSQTNWDKGRIICQWREALRQQEAPSAEYSDEAWSRRVGGVTGQHVGRLRRVFQRFGAVHQEYESLYWSHFFAALEWDDAEMWLEGAVQSGWSVSQLRRQRWETLGRPGEEPQAADEVAGESDEDFEPALREPPGAREPAADPFEPVRDAYDDDWSGPRAEGPDFGEPAAAGNAGTAPPEPLASSVEPAAPVRPFEQLAALPDDLAEAYEGLKLAILRHKADQWAQVACDDLLAALDALKALAVSPA